MNSISNSISGVDHFTILQLEEALKSAGRISTTHAKGDSTDELKLQAWMQDFPQVFCEIEGKAEPSLILRNTKLSTGGRPDFIVQFLGATTSHIVEVKSSKSDLFQSNGRFAMEGVNAIEQLHGYARLVEECHQTAERSTSLKKVLLGFRDGGPNRDQESSTASQLERAFAALTRGANHSLDWAKTEWEAGRLDVVTFWDAVGRIRAYRARLRSSGAQPPDSPIDLNGCFAASVSSMLARQLIVKFAADELDDSSSAPRWTKLEKRIREENHNHPVGWVESLPVNLFPGIDANDVFERTMGVVAKYLEQLSIIVGESFTISSAPDTQRRFGGGLLLAALLNYEESGGWPIGKWNHGDTDAATPLVQSLPESLQIQLLDKAKTIALVDSNMDAICGASVVSRQTDRGLRGDRCSELEAALGSRWKFSDLRCFSEGPDRIAAQHVAYLLAISGSDAAIACFDHFANDERTVAEATQFNISHALRDPSELARRLKLKVDDPRDDLKPLVAWHRSLYDALQRRIESEEGNQFWGRRRS